MSLTAIEREFGDAVPAVMAVMTDEEIMERYGVSANTVFRWEDTFGVKCRRRCKGCGEKFEYRQMSLTKAGRPNYGLCQTCIRTIDRSQTSGGFRIDAEFESESASIRWIRTKLYDTAGPVLYRGIQGGAHDQSCG